MGIASDCVDCNLHSKPPWSRGLLGFYGTDCTITTLPSLRRRRKKKRSARIRSHNDKCPFNEWYILCTAIIDFDFVASRRERNQDWRKERNQDWIT